MKTSKKANELLPTRRTLLEHIKNWEDQESWQEFHRLYSPLILGVARKSGLTDAEAQDVVQDTLISVAKNIREFEYDASRSFKAWLFKTTRWRIADQFRKRLPVQSAHPRRVTDDTRTATVERIPAPTNYNLDEAWDREWLEHVRTKALEGLRRKVNADHYQIFDLYVIRDWPAEKVAKSLRVSVDLVYQVKKRIGPLFQHEVKRLDNIEIS